jgi:hypothetical protein
MITAISSEPWKAPPAASSNAANDFVFHEPLSGRHAASNGPNNCGYTADSGCTFPFRRSEEADHINVRVASQLFCVYAQIAIDHFVSGCAGIFLNHATLPEQERFASVRYRLLSSGARLRQPKAPVNPLT